MTTLRQAIERDRELRKIRKPNGKLVAAENGRQFREVSSGNQVVQCPHCRAMVVDSHRGRTNHAQRLPACREAMGLD